MFDFALFRGENPISHIFYCVLPRLHSIYKSSGQPSHQYPRVNRSRQELLIRVWMASRLCESYHKLAIELPPTKDSVFVCWTPPVEKPLAFPAEARNWAYSLAKLKENGSLQVQLLFTATKLFWNSRHPFQVAFIIIIIIFLSLYATNDERRPLVNCATGFYSVPFVSS